MLRISAPAPPAPPAPQDDPSPDILAALGGDPTQDPSGKRPARYSIDKVSQDIARYLAPGSTCGSCDFFDGNGGCHLVDGKIDAAGVCSLFTPTVDDGDQSDDQPTDEPDASQQPPSPDGQVPPALQQ